MICDVCGKPVPPGRTLIPIMLRWNEGIAFIAERGEFPKVKRRFGIACSLRCLNAWKRGMVFVPFVDDDWYAEPEPELTWDERLRLNAPRFVNG